MSGGAGDEVDILLVEDNLDDEELLLHSLDGSGAPRVDVVHDGVEALEYLHATGRHAFRRGRPAPRVIVLDIRLPRVDGLEVLAEVKTDSRLRHIPVVIFTSAAQEGEMVRGYKLGANSYIVKPVDFDRFADTVRQMSSYWVRLNRGPGGSLQPSA